MSPLFKFIVRGETWHAAWRAYETLVDTGFNAGGPPPPNGQPDKPARNDPVYGQVWVWVGASNEEKARQRLESQLPADDDYDIELVESTEASGQSAD